MNDKKKWSVAIIAIFIVATVIASFGIMDMQQKNSLAPIRVACVGDSLTEGTEYPNDLWMLLGSNYSVGNFGKGGTMVFLKSPNGYLNETVFEDAKAFQPNIVVIMLGTNDALPGLNESIDEFVQDYEVLICEFQALASKPQVWIVKPPPIFNNGTGLSTLFFEENVLPGIEKVANETSLPLIDVYSRLINHPDYFVDGVHPYKRGAQIIADQVYKSLILK
jgi:acyl-CoA thioesterase-1